MFRSRWSRLLSAFWLVLALPTAGRALDREYVLRWLPSSGEVDGYRVYLDVMGQATQVLDLGAVSADPDGIAREALQLDATQSYLVSMTAYNAAGESSKSNAVTIQASTCDPAACDDGDPCTADDCQNLTCTHSRMPDGAVCGSGAVCISGICSVPQCTRDADCADGDVCDGLETCSGFRCLSGTPLVCPAPGDCQQGGCSASSGCFVSNLPDGTRCDDGNSSTTGDQCSAGHCVGIAFSGCRSDAECSDGNLCNGTETCGSSGSCLSGTPLSCGAPTQCAEPSCSPSGGCSMTPKLDGTPCDDGSSATQGDRCEAGICRGDAVEPTDPALEREYVLRWLPSSGPVSGYRAYLDALGQVTQMLDLGSVAADGDGIARGALRLDATRTYFVTLTAYNEAGESQRSNQVTIAASTCDLAACDDGNPCTADDCGESGCAHSPMPDGAICGSGSICLAGSCIVPECTRDADCSSADQAQLQCEDPTCSATGSCAMTPKPDGTACDDGSAETSGDRCEAGTCRGTAVEPEPVQPELTLTGVSPTWTRGYGKRRIVLTGTGFERGLQVGFRSESNYRAPRVLRVYVRSPEKVVVTFWAKRRYSSETWDVWVSLPDGRQAVLPGSFRTDP